MDEVNTSLIERYQLLYQKDPKSKVFATLAEAYRRLGMLSEARGVAEAGLRHHPDFASGRVALARVLMDQQQVPAAVEHLQRATALTPENILAHTLLADCHLQLKNPKEALKSYKMVLFLSPQHEKAQRAVRKLESLTADEYESDIFAMRPLRQAISRQIEVELEVAPEDDKDTRRQQVLERYLSLADAFLVRNDLERANEALGEAERLLGPNKDIERRLKLIQNRHLGEEAETPAPRATAASAPPPPNRKQLYRQRKIEYLKALLKRVDERRHPSFS